MNNRLKVSLFCLRLSVFTVMFFWTLDKFLRPEHAAAVFGNFYFLSGIGDTVMTAVGVAELVLILGFLAGQYKRVTYGLVTLLHAVSTLSSYKQYFAPFDKGNLLFFAAWPMLAACLTLFLLREDDTLFTIKKRINLFRHTPY